MKLFFKNWAIWTAGILALVVVALGVATSAFWSCRFVYAHLGEMALNVYFGFLVLLATCGVVALAETLSSKKANK